MDSSSTSSSSAPLTQAERDEQLLNAALNGDTDTVSALIAAGANVNAAGQYGYTALMKAAFNGHIAIVSLLIAAGANVNAASQYGYTALMKAAARGYTATALALIAAGANVNAANQRGETALMWAAAHRHNKTAFCLLNAMSPQEISATRPTPTPSFTNRLLRRQPIITPVEAAYNQALIELRQSFNNVFNAFNSSGHNLGTTNALLNIIAGYYAPNWYVNPNQEMSRDLALTERRRPVILSRTSRAMNRLLFTLISLTNAVTPALFRFTEEPAAEQGSSKKARRE
jgi:ankyrin repeat protein